MPTLKGKTLFITGASRGIGLAIGLRAARDGANVVIEPRSVGEPVMEARIGLEKSSLARVRSALRRRGANPSEEYGRRSSPSSRRPGSAIRFS